MLIQACQVDSNHRFVDAHSDEDPAPTQLSAPHRAQHITLTRPHTALLHSAVRGGVAYRGVFTGALADELRSADGKSDIYDIHSKACARMEKYSRGPEQVPRFESTLKKRLVLPSFKIES